MEIQGKLFVCCICGQYHQGDGNNPEPVKPAMKKNGSPNRCCDECNFREVVTARIKQLHGDSNA